MIRVMIVDDHPVVRDGLEAMLESARGFVVCASFGDGESAAAAIAKVKPDVVVLDIRLPGMDGFATLEKMRRHIPDVRAIFLAGMPLGGELDRARGMGACGYLPKNIVHTRLLEAMRSAVDGGPFQEEELPKVPSMLTAKEMSVLKYLAMGKTREEVGIILGVSTETVKTHSKSIQVKLDAPNTTGAVSRAYELGILRP